MKHISLLIAALSMIVLLTGCNGSKSKPNNNVIVDPTDNIPVQESVQIVQTMDPGGAISHINLTVILPAGTTQSLLHYNGQVTIKGTIEMNPAYAPCIKAGPNQFDCQAQLSGRTITAKQSNCAIGHGFQLWDIFLGGSAELKTTYSIVGITISDIPLTCYNP